MEKEIKREIIDEIIRIGIQMDQKGMVNAFEGNLSIKDRETGLLYITPSGKRKIELTPDMIAVLDEDGKLIAGRFKPSSELPMHTHSYLMRPDVNAVIHCHSPYLTAYAICNKPVVCRAYAEFMMLAGDMIPVVPYGKPGTDEIYAKMGPFLKNHNIVLLGNHGPLSVGPDLATAFNRMDSSERIARIINIAKSVGELSDLPDYEIARLFE